MSHIGELIVQLAPNGVPFMELGEVAKYSDTRVAASTVDSETYVGVDNLRQNQRGRTSSDYVPTSGNLTGYRVGDVLIGNIRPYLKKIWLATNNGGCNGDVLAIRIGESFRDSLMPEFLYRVLSSESFFSYDMQHAKGAKMPRGNKSMIMKYRVPVPPITIQQEIVATLAHFSDLETELEGELASRRRQYDFYRNSFMSSLPSDTEWTQLGHVASVRVGQAPGSEVLAEAGPYAFVNAGTGESGRASQANTPGDTVTIPSRGQGGVGVVGFQAHEFWCGPLCYRINSSNARLQTRFLYHYLKSIQPAIRGLQQTGGTPALNRKELILVNVPIPAPEVQESASSLLDKFDALVNDTSIGLPAEITARRKQYEYYRDQLLSFQELAA